MHIFSAMSNMTMEEKFAILSATFVHLNFQEIWIIIYNLSKGITRTEGWFETSFIFYIIYYLFHSSASIFARLLCIWAKTSTCMFS